MENYSTIHWWISYKFGKASCCEFGNHPAKRYEWANKSKKYLRDRSDWMMLCPSCHRKFDYTDQQREKMRTINLGNKNRARKISRINPSTNEIKSYSSIKIAAKENKVIRTSISNMLAGRAKTAGGYIWQI